MEQTHLLEVDILSAPREIPNYEEPKIALTC